MVFDVVLLGIGSSNIVSSYVDSQVIVWCKVSRIESTVVLMALVGGSAAIYSIFPGVCPPCFQGRKWSCGKSRVHDKDIFLFYS